MSSYNDFLQVVASLSTGTSFAITYDWCANKKLTLAPGTAKAWGARFAKEYTKYNCVLRGKGTDNHNFYEKL